MLLDKISEKFVIILRDKYMYVQKHIEAMSIENLKRHNYYKDYAINWMTSTTHTYRSRWKTLCYNEVKLQELGMCFQCCVIYALGYLLWSITEVRGEAWNVCVCACVCIFEK